MELFVLNDQLLQLQQDLSHAEGLSRWQLQAELAWQLRERDSRAALKLADDLLQSLPSTHPDYLKLIARAHLVRGETLRLFAELNQAQATAQQSLQLFEECKNLIGRSDANSLLAWVAMDRGDTQERDIRLELAADLALQAGDKLRADVACLTQARAAVFRDVQQATDRWGAQFTLKQAQDNPALAACIYDFLATAAGQYSDFATAIEYWIHSHETSQLTGQIRRAAVTATNIGNSFNSLNEHNTALDWMQRGLDIARPTAWPGTVGGCLMQTGETLRRLGRLDAGYDILREAQHILSKLPNSRNYAITLEYLGDLMLDRSEFSAALDIFNEQQERADLLGQADFQISAHRGKAHALSYLDQPGPALFEAQTALELARQHNDAYNQIQILRVLAEIHLLHSLPTPEAMHAPNPVLHYLLQAIEVAQSIAGYTVPSELYDALGREYARIGHFALAYSMALQAGNSREKTHSDGATNRAIAMQVSHQTERAQAEGEHHRQLAESEAHRAEILLQTSNTLERLSSIGQEITAHLDAAAVFHALDRHLHGLIGANSLSVLMLEADGKHLRLVFGNENGQALPSILVDVENQQANSARCLRERREILIELEPDMVREQTYLPGTARNLSMLFGPLAVGDHVLGVMSVQSQREHVFGERERLIFRTLCAYGAIAFDNSATYLQLKATLQTLSETQEQLASAARLQTRLVEQKMAAEQLARQRAEEATQMKSAFLANMSHEIRTPMNAVIGLAHLALRTDLNAKQQDYLSKIHRAGMSLLGIINDILDFSKIEAGKLDIEQTAFSLDDVLANVASVSSQKAAEKGLEYLFRIPHVIPRHLVGDALRLGQVLINLVNNAIKFTESGEIELACQLVPNRSPASTTPIRLQFSVRDTGIGMSAEQLALLFQPFTQADGSTSRKFGGTGLGLSISQHLVHLMGEQIGAQIQVESITGQGSRFFFELPFALANVAVAPPQLPPALQNARLLVVDDNPIALEIFVDALRTLPLRVDAVTSGVQALHALQQADQANDAYQLVISDWQMPELDGITLARKIRADQTLRHTPKFILATAFGREEVQEQAEHAGIAGFLYKPVSESLLYNTLHSVFAPHLRMVVQTTTPQYRFDNLRILLAEDNEINQQIAQELLAAVGLEVELASNGVELLAKLHASSATTYPLVLMDLEMPELDGHTATAQIRQDRRFDSLIIIAMTAHALPEIRERCLQNGMQDYLTKPIHPEQLYSTLMRWLKPSVIQQPLPDQSSEAQQLISASPALLSKVSNTPDTNLGNLSIGTQAAQSALEQLSALLHFNGDAALEYFASIESGLALLLDQTTLTHIAAMLHRQEFDATGDFLDDLLQSWSKQE